MAVLDSKGRPVRTPLGFRDEGPQPDDRNQSAVSGTQVRQPTIHQWHQNSQSGFDRDPT